LDSALDHTATDLYGMDEGCVWQGMAGSYLKRQMLAGQFVQLCEIHAPRSGQLGDFVEQGRRLKPHFDAMTVTGQIKGRQVMPSPEAAGHLRAIGVESIAVLSGRDCNATSLMAEMAVLHCSDVGNVICLSGDGGATATGQVQMASVDMLRMASEVRDDRRMWLGAVINPFSTPASLPMIQLKQKLQAGANFLLTQMIFDVCAFETFMKALMVEGLEERARVVAGVPVVINDFGLALAKRLPGVWLPECVERQLEGAVDIRQCGIEMAKQTIKALRQMRGLAGVNLMLLGSKDPADLLAVVQ
jgi:methylenetetrahydrofolate reductase (NADPH)